MVIKPIKHCNAESTNQQCMLLMHRILDSHTNPTIPHATHPGVMHFNKVAQIGWLINSLLLVQTYKPEQF